MSRIFPGVFLCSSWVAPVAHFLKVVAFIFVAGVVNHEEFQAGSPTSS